MADSIFFFFFFSSRRRHTRSDRDWSSDVCSSDLAYVQLDWHGFYLWVANPTRQSVPVQLNVRERLGGFSATRTVWGSEASCDGRLIKLTAPARDITVLELVQ